MKIKEFGNLKIAYREGTSDECVLQDVFENGYPFTMLPEYKLKSDDVIINIGAHIGAFAILAASKLKQSKVYAIEASKENFKLLKLNVTLNKLSNVFINNLAITDSEDTIRLYHRNKDPGGYTITEVSEEYEEVATQTLSNYMKGNNIANCDFMLLNCEGAEFKIVLNTPKEILKRIKLILILYHLDLCDGYSENDLIEHLRKCGFSTRIRYKDKKNKRGWLIAGSTMSFHFGGIKYYLTRLIKICIINLMMILLSMSMLLASLEVYLRLFEPNRNLTPGTYISHPTRRYTLRPNFSGRTFGRPYKINSLGLRDYEYKLFAKEKGTFRILCVGDSFTFGIGVNLEDTYPKQLEKLLKTRYPDRKIEVINCGVPSYNTVYEYLFLKEEGLQYKPDLIIVGYVYNDSMYNIPFTPSKYKSINTLKDILRKLHSYEFIVDRFYRINYVFRGFTSKDPKYRMKNLEYTFSDEFIGWKKNKEAFRLLAALSRNNGIPIMYIIFPKLENLKKDYPFLFFHQKVKEALKNEPYILDLLPHLEGRKAEDLWVTNYDSHCNAEANAIISKAILNFLISAKLIDRPS